MKYYKEFADFLTKYEDNNDKSKVQLGATYNVRLVSGDDKSHLKFKLDSLGKELQNPFIHVRNWIKSEIMNLHALCSSIAAKEACDARKQQAISRIASLRQTLAKMQQGKFMIGKMFQSTSSKQSEMQKLTTQVQQLDRDVKNWDVIKRFLTIYLAEVAIP